MVRELIDKQLSTFGHTTVLVEDGQQAIDTYQKLQQQGTPADIVILDLTIPGAMGGQEAAQRILQHDPDAKMIVASGYSNDPIMSNYRQYGFIAAIAKPFDMEELESLLHRALLNNTS